MEQFGVPDKLALLHKLVFKCNQRDAMHQENSDAEKSLRTPVSMWLNMKS